MYKSRLKFIEALFWSQRSEIEFVVILLELIVWPVNTWHCHLFMKMINIADKIVYLYIKMD